MLREHAVEPTSALDTGAKTWTPDSDDLLFPAFQQALKILQNLL